MAIYKAANLIEVYRAKSKSKDINELTGRTGRPDLTRFVTRNIIAKLPLNESSCVVDVGCGHGLLLHYAAEMGVNPYKGRLIGILPTKEEVSRVRAHLLDDPAVRSGLISIELGTAERTGLPDGFADVAVCNSVIHGAGRSLEDAKAALAEFNRILKPGCVLFLGELPDSDEFAGRNCGDSITGWLFYVLKNQGLDAFLARLKQVALALVGEEPFVVAPKKLFYSPPGEFIDLARQFGFEPIEHYRHVEIHQDAGEGESATRWDYLLRKISAVQN
ncbi:class I SAM-dependent methyltransferase [Methylocystis heyeri]|uniref:Methyltransferase domain-containing protein n=1 Tax=Methylocystis heyeri TaxID=391905 RepID=A0A6B8KA13_9HYPH|nr:class I SAM-dependent methyltransferase [Methylocystis heyeri]QGM44926.1 methyltransferase domain-containing protein [Methylocystis heyeri]